VLVNPSARDNVLLLGLVDWVPLERVHYEVAKASNDMPLSKVQTATLELIKTLVGEGLFVLGELAHNGARFVPWDTPLDTSMERLREVYVQGFDNADAWQWFGWLDLTKMGEQVALPIEERVNSPLGT
jgi:hypothetical protein